MTQEFDIIGDIHGCATALERLLEKLNYKKNGNVYTHKTRKVIFLGDFIDRGPAQKQTLNIVRPMIESGAAYSVMGNHEFNAICFTTKHEGQFLRAHSDKNLKQHEAFLKEYPIGSEEYADMIAWFKTLPVYLNLKEIGIVHACWCADSFHSLKDILKKNNTLKDSAYIDHSQKINPHYDAIERVLKGPEFPLPPPISFEDKDGNPRHHARIKWWSDDILPTIERLEFGGFKLNEEFCTIINQQNIPQFDKPEDMLLFVGHYWLRGDPTPLSEDVACVDYSIAKGGILTAYRYSGEDKIQPENFIWVD